MDERPVLNALIIGIDKYKGDIPDIRLAVKDARDLADVLKAQEEQIFSEVGIRLLLDEDATARNIYLGASWLRQNTTSDDVAMIAFFGHGGTTPELDEHHIISHDTDLDEIWATGIPVSRLLESLAITGKKTLLILDSTDGDGVLAKYSPHPHGPMILTSASPDEYSVETANMSNGVFVSALLEGLNGAAATDGEGVITINQLADYVITRTPELLPEGYRGGQNPQFHKPLSSYDFPIAVAGE
ncbi:MAG: caspase family protein [Candidatus Sumerlaeia bacterium]|nr:caspase family protein [Candidatus Sumerlaeia bacterium]